MWVRDVYLGAQAQRQKVDDRDDQGRRVVALSRIEHPGNAAEVPQIQLVLLVRRAHGSQNQDACGCA